MTTVKLALDYVVHALSQTEARPFLVGISGPQGSGKSYLADHLIVELVKARPNLKPVGMLIDDFYLLHQEQMELTKYAKSRNNKLLQGRGLPGSHDLGLCVEVLQKLLNFQHTVRIPRYDKSAFNGEGDRVPEDKWQIVEEKPDVVIFEGWFCGFRSLDVETFPILYLSEDPGSIVQRTAMHHLEKINENLRKYEEVWNLFNGFVFLQTPSLENVYKWRREQELALIKRYGSGMTPRQVDAFVDRYMPLYVLYYWRMCRDGVAGVKNLRIRIASNRAVEAHDEF